MVVTEFPALGEDLHQILCKITSSQIKTKDGVRQSVTVQRQDSLDRHVHGGHVESLLHDLRHALSVGLGVQGSFREQNGTLFRRNPEFVVERVMQDFLHDVPIREDTVIDQRSR